MTDPSPDTDGRQRLSRRRLLTGGLAGLGGLAAGAALAGCDGDGTGAATAGAGPTTGPAPVGAAVEPFHGAHQSGVMTSAQAHAVFVAYDLAPGTDRDALGRLMRLLSDDAARLTQGRPALADTEPELAAAPSRLTITFGFGPAFVAAAGRPVPAQLRPLPSFAVDRLEERWSGGDLLLQVCCDDPTTLAHAERMLHKDTRAFARIRWTQRGFLHARGATADGTTPRNLMGQVDGTVNPTEAQADDLVWADDDRHPWLNGGTFAVVRRIRMTLDTWDSLDRDSKELAVGRRLSDGAPLTGDSEHDDPDLAATDANGLPVIPDFAHCAEPVATPPLRSCGAGATTTSRAPRTPGWCSCRTRPTSTVSSCPCNGASTSSTC